MNDAKMFPWFCTAVLTLALVAGSQAVAQQSAPEAPPEVSAKNSAETAPEAAAETPADPTQPSPQLRQAMVRSQAAGGNRVAVADRLPEIRLRACVIAADRPPAAVVQIGSNYYRVRPGSEVLAPVDGGTVSLLVEQISPSGVRIVAPSLDRTIVLN